MNGVTCQVAPNHLKSAIEAVAFPVSFLDCECEGIQIRNFRYSLRIIHEIGARPMEITHEKMLWPFFNEPRHCFINRLEPIRPSEMRVEACQLADDLSAEGSILVWDKEAAVRVLTGLTMEFPDLTEMLRGCTDRIVEMKPWFENCIVWSPLEHKPQLETVVRHFFPELPGFESPTNQQHRSYALAELYRMTYRINQNITNDNADE